MLEEEQLNLGNYDQTSIMISTTAKHALDFKVLPRRTIKGMAMSCFMINDEKVLEETLTFFDGKVDYIYIDIEQKQHVNLFKIARSVVKQSRSEEHTSELQSR